MMKYLCLGYLVRERMDARSSEEVEALMRDCRPHMEKLYRTKQVLIDVGVTTESRHLRRVGTQVVVTDTAPGGASELIGSALLIEAESWEDAIRVASLHPTLLAPAAQALGWRMEIRPIHSFQAEPSAS
jgi:hypothetical protein